MVNSKIAIKIDMVLSLDYKPSDVPRQNEYLSGANDIEMATYVIQARETGYGAPYGVHLPQI